MSATSQSQAPRPGAAGPAPQNGVGANGAPSAASLRAAGATLQRLGLKRIGALYPLPQVVPYSGAKSALNAMTVSFAREYGPKVRVNTISPGPFLTDIANAWTPEARKKSDNALGRLNAYKAVPGTFPKAERNYHAVMFTAEKRLSNRFSLLGSYTYSRTFGNYPGTFSSSNGQLDPNISSQFDLVDLLANRNGPLPTDRPHNFKLTGFYTQPIGSKGNLIASLTFTAYSGRPILVLGFHPYYGSREVFILPPGAGGRTPTITQFDMHVGYEHLLSKQVRLSVYADLVNMFNQRGVTNVDDEYTASVVAPILNGQSKDLLKLRTGDGSLPVLNPNYGNATSYQIPLFMRFGARLSF